LIDASLAASSGFDQPGNTTGERQMRTFHQSFKLAILFACMGVAASASADGSHALQYREEWSGSYVPSADADVDGDMQGGAIGTTVGDGTAGRTSMTAWNDVAQWDGETFCDFDADGNPVAVPVYYVSIDTVSRVANGDLLYGRLASSPPSPLCFNFNDSTFTFEVYLDVVGGTGQFEDATGQLHFIGGGRELHTGFGSQFGTAEGVIYGVHPPRRGDHH
jgi:hypothetical protein